MDDQERLRNIIARSSLTPTAEEFIPRSQSKPHASTSNRPQYSKEYYSRHREPKYDREREGRWKKMEVFRLSNEKENDKEKHKKKNNFYQPHTYEVKNSYPKKVKVDGLKKNENIDKNWRKDVLTKPANQMEVLVVQLTNGSLECLVCCDVIKQNHQIWSCTVCHHVLHLRCIDKWAKSSSETGTWRCPACNQPNDFYPTEYLCFCGKLSEPVWNRVDCPHTCGQVCGLPRAKNCPHLCSLLCHPGPCPPCGRHVTSVCPCGKTSDVVLCPNQILCREICGKLLKCEVHFCKKLCHNGDCDLCQEIVVQECFCGTSKRDFSCRKNIESFCCGKLCAKKLSCGHHECPLICHQGECSECPLSPHFVKTCPCGKTDLEDNQVRNSCTDPIPTCDKICEKNLLCGDLGNPHKCQATCHEGPCPPCPLQSNVKCKCGYLNTSLNCAELTVSREEFRCQKRCNKKHSCGKHRCPMACCTAQQHPCPQTCSRTLSCGQHRCQAPCHYGYCRPCEIMSWEELTCECGAEVLLPPVPCGTRRPACRRLCSREHACGCEPTHNCHSESTCPPCTTLATRPCHGKHEYRRAVPCHQSAFSCGLPCGKQLPCQRHNCIQPCHSGDCPPVVENGCCGQICGRKRETCGHGCALKCHDGDCPIDVDCRVMVKVTCECGNRTSARPCVDNLRDNQRLTAAQIASKMSDLDLGESIDIRAITNKKISFKTLECNEDCQLYQRNLRLQMALQIRNPDLSAKLTPRYSELLKNWAKKEPAFCQMVHDKLTELVQLAKQSKQKSRSFSFDPMNSKKRQFIHEYCEHFGCESVAYDQEPKRNVVATAIKDKSWLPGLSLLEVVQRESGARKVPIPVNSKLQLAGTSQKKHMETLTSKNISNGESKAQPSASASSTSNSETTQKIDYFEMS